MSRSTDHLLKYYGGKGDYLKDHDLFLSSANIQKDLVFLGKALTLKKIDAILDIACGQGRHVNALREKGYDVDGVDFSAYLITKAREGATITKGSQPHYYKSNIERLALKRKYDKAYWFFSDLAGINIQKALLSINKTIKKGGKVLIDTDNIFRIVSYLTHNPSSPFVFDARAFELIEKKTKVRVPYPPYPLWSQWMKSSGFFVEHVWGGYDFSNYSVDSPRLILVIKKVA